MWLDLWNVSLIQCNSACVWPTQCGNWYLLSLYWYDNKFCFKDHFCISGNILSLHEVLVTNHHHNGSLSSDLTLLTWPLRSVTVARWTTLQDHVIICSYLPGSCSLLLGPTNCFHWFTASVFARTSANTGPLYRVVTINREHTQHIPAHISNQAREEHFTIVFCIKVASLLWSHVKAAWL